MPGVDVLIVGAGPSGLVAALALAQSGVSIRIIDKLTEPRVGQKGPAIQPRTLELYKLLGVLDDILKRARFAQPIVHYKLPGGTEVAREFNMFPWTYPTADCPYPNPLMLGQDRHEEILRAHLQRYGIQVEWATELVHFTQDDNKVHVRISKGDAIDISKGGATATPTNNNVEELDVAYLIGADGGHSKVRKILGLNFLGETRELDKMLAGDIVVKPPGLARDKWHAWGDPQTRVLGLRPCEAPDDDKLAILVTGKDVDYGKASWSSEDFAKLFHEITGRTDVQFGETIGLTVWRPNIRMIDHFSVGRVFIIGDAAHTHSPTGGQGMNSSVQDAANLAWKLALVLKGHAAPSLLDSYTTERVPVIREMLERTTRLLDRTMRPGEDTDEAWHRRGPLHMLGIHYRWSPIVMDQRRSPPSADERESAYVGSEGLCAGDRAPDAPVEGDAARLFDLFKITRHTVLVFSADLAFVDEVTATIDKIPNGLCDVAVVLPRGTTPETFVNTKAAKVLTDKDGEAYKAYEVYDGNPTVFVVRPDGVIGAVVKNGEGVENYFSKLVNVVG
ncbi:FAD binding domain-containing protein [Schizophyllum commune]